MHVPFVKTQGSIRSGGLYEENSNFRENISNDAAEPAASRTCLFPSPFLRERGGDGDSLLTVR